MRERGTESDRDRDVVFQRNQTRSQAACAVPLTCSDAAAPPEKRAAAWNLERRGTSALGFLVEPLLTVSNFRAKSEFVYQDAHNGGRPSAPVHVTSPSLRQPARNSTTPPWQETSHSGPRPPRQLRPAPFPLAAKGAPASWPWLCLCLAHCSVHRLPLGIPGGGGTVGEACSPPSTDGFP